MKKDKEEDHKKKKDRKSFHSKDKEPKDKEHATAP